MVLVPVCLFPKDRQSSEESITAPTGGRKMGKRLKTIASSTRNEGSGPFATTDEEFKPPAVDFSRKQLHEYPFSKGDSSDELLESDEEAEINRIGNVPLWWYDNFQHVGKRRGGRRLILEHHSIMCSDPRVQFGRKEDRKNIG